MANENITINYPNFCRGPVDGTICTIDTSSAQTVMHVKNTTGGTIIDLTLSSNILNDNVRVEYVGPYGLPAMEDDLTFFTFEKVSDTTCMIKRWATRVTFRELILKEQIIKSNTGYEYYNALDFAVEYYHRTIEQPVEYYNYLYLSSTTNIKTGTKLILGPSTDTDNLGAMETVTVSHLSSVIDGTRVYLTSPTTYQYTIDDPITFYSHVYICSEDGYAGDTAKGTIFKIDAYSWNTTNVDLKAVYKKVTAMRWCPYISGLSCVVGTNMLFFRPYDSYNIWRSMFLSNVEDDDNTTFPVYDLLYNDYSVYKLQRKTTLRDDTGGKETHEWDTYNYQADTLLPYTNSIVTYAEQNIVTGHAKTVDFEAQVRDQYHVALRDTMLNFYFSGDPNGFLTPIDGEATTDVNGKATMQYTSGSTYTGHTEITTRAAGSSTSHGSQYVWTSNNVLSYPESDTYSVGLSQKLGISGQLNALRQILNSFKKWVDEDTYEDIYISLFGKSFFTSPGGDWGEASTNSFYDTEIVEEWLPLLYREDQQDAPKRLTPGTFSTWCSEYDLESCDGWNIPAGEFNIPNLITLVLDETAAIKTQAVTDYLIYREPDVGEGHGIPPYCTITCPDESGEVPISQLKLSLHTYWADGQPYDYLWTDTEIDQFVFVEDAVPAFYSEKNAPETNIWIRLRPFAFSLDMDTLRMWVREISYEGDTGYVEVTDNLDIITFDAGSGLLGLEVDHNPTTNFQHGSTIFVLIEVYDEAYDPNFITVEYWFKVVPDYKAPYIFNMSPDTEDENVDVDTTIYFEIKDEGTGVDIDTLECLLNSRRMLPQHITTEKVSKYHYKVTYTPPEPLYYDKNYKVTVKVKDLSDQENVLNASYRFYTGSSAGLVIQDMNPAPCKRGMGRFQSVDVKILADGTGIDADSVRLQVYNKDVVPSKVPIIYRVI